MARRYELPYAAWELIKDLVSPEPKVGRPRSDDRLVLNGIFGILSSGVFAAMATLVCTLRCLRQYFSYKTQIIPFR